MQLASQFAVEVCGVQNRISSCCSCRVEMCFLPPHVQEQVLVFVLVSFGEFGAGIVARAGEALFRCSVKGGDWDIRWSLKWAYCRKSGLGWHIQRELVI